MDNILVFLFSNSLALSLYANMKLLVCIRIGPLGSLHRAGSVFPKDHFFCTLKALKYLDTNSKTEYTTGYVYVHTCMYMYMYNIYMYTYIPILYINICTYIYIIFIYMHVYEYKYMYIWNIWL